MCFHYYHVVWEGHSFPNIPAVCAHMCVHELYVCACVCVCVCVCVHMCVHMCMCTRMHVCVILLCAIET